MSQTSSPTAEQTPVPSEVRRRLLAVFVALAAAVLVLDQATKVWALDALEPGVSRPLVGDLLQLTLVFNPGAALSIGNGMTWVLTILVAVVSVVIVRASRRLGSTLWAVTLGLTLGGALGNLVDRLFRDPGFARGHVIDFIDYGVFVGNVADIAIVGAAGLAVVLAMKGIQINGTRTPAGAPADEGAPPRRPEAPAPEGAADRG